MFTRRGTLITEHFSYFYLDIDMSILHSRLCGTNVFELNSFRMKVIFKNLSTIST